MATEILTVEGMTCGHCAKRVEKCVMGLDGVTGVSVDLESKKVTVETDGTADAAKIKQAIEETGYTVR